MATRDDASATTTATRSPRANSRAAANARTQILEQLKDDHKRVKKAYRAFQKAEEAGDNEAVEAIVNQVLDELSVHAALEEELLYPAARTALADGDLIDEAEVEHESVHTFIEQLRGMSASDDKYCARFTVLCEYVLHHVKEEEGEMFPQLEKARLDWESLAASMRARREELTPEVDDGDPVGAGVDHSADEDSGRGPGTAPARKRATAHRSQGA